MRFCKECNNMLYSTENKDLKQLKFLCKTCGYSETLEKSDESTNCVSRNEVKLSQSAIKIDPCIINDPTYSRTRNSQCPECSYPEAIYFQNPNVNDTGMKLIFVCCNIKNGIYCGKWWFNKAS